MLYRLLTLLIAVLLVFTGMYCINLYGFGPVFTGSILCLAGLTLFIITLFCILEQIMNEDDDTDIDDDRL